MPPRTPPKMTPVESPDAYVTGLTGWRAALVTNLRAAALSTPGLREGVKWGHLVYQGVGPVCLIRPEDARVLFGFWRGKRLRALEPRLKPGGKYEMATLDLREGDDVGDEVVRALLDAAVRLNEALGDPTEVG